MKNRILLIIERLMLTLWVGSLCAVGLMVAPLLFARLEDSALAGTLAGNLFALTAMLGLVCGSILLISSIVRTGHYGWRVWITTVMLLLVAIGQFVLAPGISDLRARGLVESAEFSLLHGLAGALFMLTAGLGLVLAGAGQAARNVDKP